MNSITAMILLLVSGVLTVTVASYSINDAHVDNAPSVAEGRARRATAPDIMNNTVGLGSTLTGLLNGIGLTRNGTTSNPATTIQSLQDTLRAITADDVRGVLLDSNPLATFLNNIPLIGPILNLLRSILGLTGNLLDRVVSLVVNLLHCVAETLPVLLQ